MAVGGDKRNNAVRSRNGVALTSDVLTPQGRTVASDPDRGSGRQPDRSPRIKWPQELLRIGFGLLGGFTGLLLIGICAGLAVMGYIGVGVLRDIGKSDYSEAMQRIQRYQTRFDAMKQAGYRISESKPKMLEGKTTYLWVVTPPGSDDRIVYRWKHYLQTNDIEPLTNPALLLDLALGSEALGNAANYKFYDPNDKLARALAERDFSAVSPDQIAERWQASELPNGPVLAPLIPPDKARGRAMKASEEEEAVTDPNAPVDPNAPGDSTDVGGDAPPDQDGGDSSDVGNGNGGGGGGETAPPEDNGGGQTPPDDDAVPVG